MLVSDSGYGTVAVSDSGRDGGAPRGCGIRHRGTASTASTAALRHCGTGGTGGMRRPRGRRLAPSLRGAIEIPYIRDSVRRIAVLLIALIPACAGSAPVPGPPLEPLPPVVRVADGAGGVPAFSGDNAYAHIVTQVGFGPRVPGTAGHARQLEWMRAWLSARADSVEVQRFVHTTMAGERLELANVIARFRPAAERRILLLAHWDTRPTADYDPAWDRRGEPIPGANDGGSGVAVLLELADVLFRHSPPIGVDLLFTDGEDFGPTTRDMFLGASHFAANLPPGYAPMYGILLDMVADRQPEFRVEGHSRRFAPEVVERVWSLAESLGYGEVFLRRGWGEIGDDHVPLNRAGLRTISIIDFDYGPGNAFWHTHADDLPNVGPAGPAIVGRVLVELIYRGG
jgi:glutaminyl-peptide cyclotransferase